MGEIVAKQQLREFYDRELNEIKQNKARFGLIIASLIISLALFLLADEDTESKNISDSEAPTVVSTAKEEVAINNKAAEKASKLTTITGLEKAAEGVEIINPFKVDTKQNPNDTAKTPKTPPAVPIFEPPQPVKTQEPKEKVILILKGTAISGNKKMAIIQRSISNKNDKDKSESLILNIGDEVDGRMIIEINKDFVMFDDGKRLYVQKDQEDE